MTISRDLLIWDAHECFPLSAEADMSALERYRLAGFHFISINIGMDMNPMPEVIKIVSRYRSFIRTHSDKYVLARRASDVQRAREEGQLAIAFDLEGSDPLDGKISMVSLYYDLGVRQMLLAYNKDNAASGGCQGADLGLTDYGRQIIEEMNRVGMVVDVSHMSFKASMEAMEMSDSPVIFSHSNSGRLKHVPRNISDEQILTCAETGGVVGINGIGDFLGENDISPEKFVEHIDYIAQLAGPQHVGLGLDYVVDQAELAAYLKAHPDIYPPGSENTKFVAPEALESILDCLVKKGYSDEDLRAIMGGNFLRVAEQVWK